MQSTLCALARPATCARLPAAGPRRPASGPSFVGLARPGPLRRRSPARRAALVRAHLEDIEGALSSAADSLPSWLDHAAAHLTTSLLLLGDAALETGLPTDAAGAADVAAAAGDAAAEAANKNGGFFGVFSTVFESFLKTIDNALDGLGLPYSYGFSIILLTLLVKLATYPLTKKQVESTMALQALQPRVKELQAKFAGDAERLQVETAKLYQSAGVNPLAGCLPTLATIPVFIGLYRALSNVADEGLLTEGFFWIPSLAGPTKLNGGLGWLVPVDGVPPNGWAATAAYLVMPVLLVVSQAISQKIISPPASNDPQQQQSQAILKFLPLMIGYFSLNVPSGLTLYWLTNNIVTTAQQMYLRSKFALPAAAAAGGGAAAPARPAAPAEPEEKKPTGKELGSRRKGDKFRALQAREAASRAAAQAGGGAAEAAAPAQVRGARFAELKAKDSAGKAGAGGEAARAQQPAAVVSVEVLEGSPSGSNGALDADAGPVVIGEIVEEGQGDGEASDDDGSAAKQGGGGRKPGKPGKKGGKRK